MQEALQQVRDDLGEQAVILNTRQIRRNNRFNTGEEARVEVMAALDDSAALAKEPAPSVVRPSAGVSRLAAQRYGAHSAVNEPMDSLLAAADESATEAPAQEEMSGVGNAGGQGEKDLGHVMRHLRHIQETLMRVERKGNASTLVMTDALSRLSERLRNMGVAPSLVEDISAGALRALSGDALEDRKTASVIADASTPVSFLVRAIRDASSLADSCAMAANVFDPKYPLIVMSSSIVTGLAAGDVAAEVVMAPLAQ